ncbi:MAG: ABC transporter substrate-binding protein, partial [Alphaproteobacteria bacterium]
MRIIGVGLAAAGALAAVSVSAQAPKDGGILKFYHRDSPASASIHEESSFSTNAPFMSIFNNLVMYKQDVPQNSMDSIIPDLATSWSWSADRKTLTFKLREGVKWHDGKPFTSADVKCTWDLLQGKSKDSFRKNPREAWYQNVEDVKPNGANEVSFVLGRPQPALLALLASGYTPVYPCHVSARDMRTKPIGTGPFKFVEFKANESIKLTKNTDYWKKGKPHLDGIDFTIVRNRSTAILAFIAGKFDITFPTEVTIPLLKDVKAQAPNAICELAPTNVSTNLIVNREAPPFDKAEIRSAMALAIDRKAFVDIMSEGKNDIGGSMLPPPAGI